MQAAAVQKQTNILLLETEKKESQSLDEYLQNTANLLCETLEISYCIIFSDEGELKNHYVSQTNLKTDKLITFCKELVENYQSILFQGQPLAFSSRDRLFNLLSRKITATYQICSLLIVPIMHQQSYLGEIAIFSCDDRQWMETELKLVRIITKRCAFEILQNQLDKQIKYQKWQQKLFNQILEKINTNSEPEDSLADILVILGENFQAEQVIIFDLREEPSKIYQQWQSDRNIPALTTLNIPWWKEFQKLESHQASTTLNFFSKLPDRKSFSWHAPIFIKGKFFGVLTLQTKVQIRSFATEEINILNLVAQQIAIAIENIQTQKRLKELQEWNNNLAAEKQLSEAANQAKSVFLSHMNHELRTPLTGILGFARMLKDEIYGSLNSKQKQYVSAIASSGEHLLSLVNDFLDISKIEANREELLLETMAVEDLCIASLSMVESRAKEQGLDLRLEIAPSVDLCQADRRRVIQILVNLLSNAIKFTEMGAVTLRVQRHEEKLEFCVIDTGIGIKKADQEKLFQPFQQINNPLSRKHKGTGLGLTLSRKLARLHDGDLTLTSEEGKGSCFTLHLPV